MSLNATVIRPDVLRAFTSGLGNYIDPSRPLWSVMQKEYVAQPWYSLILPEIVKLENAPTIITEEHVIPTGWRFVATDGDLYGGCHVGSPRRDAPPMLTGFSWDTQILTFMESLEDLKALPEVARGQFDLRVLSIRLLHFEAFWLYANDGTEDPTQRANDIVIPYTGFVEGPPNYLDLMCAYPVRDFMTAIWVCARNAVKQYNDFQEKTTTQKNKPTAQKAQETARAQQAAWPPPPDPQPGGIEPRGRRTKRRAPRKKRA
jgi:hypothetical protein